jgi:predicted nucleic acid-binding Zn ribbon protein
MPTYTYECRKCGNVYDRVQRITDSPYTSCDVSVGGVGGGGVCGGEVRRLITGAGFLLKGGGWYRDGY